MEGGGPGLAMDTVLLVDGSLDGGPSVELSISCKEGGELAGATFRAVVVMLARLGVFVI